MNNLKYLVFLILCILQPICLPFPEATTILSGTLSIGPNCTFFISLIGILTGIIIMYKISHYFSSKFLKKYQNNNKFLLYKKLVSTNPFLTTGILFAIPILPDEIVCVGSALGDIPLKIIVPIAIIAKSVSIGMTTYSSKIASIFDVNEWQVIVIEILLMIILGMVYRIIKHVK